MNSKKKKNILIGIIVVIAVIIFLGINGNFPLSVTTPSGDMTIDSISKTTINGEDAIRIAVTVNRGGEQLSIDFGQDTLNNALANSGIKDLKATKAVLGKMTFNEESSFFGYRQLTSAEGGQVVYKKLRWQDIGVFTNCTLDSCKSSISLGTNEELLSARRYIGCACLIASEKASAGTFVNTEKGDFKVTFTIDGIGSTQLSRSKLSDAIGTGTIRWNGNKGSLDSFSIANSRQELFVFNSNLVMQEDGTRSNMNVEYNKVVSLFNTGDSNALRSSSKNGYTNLCSTFSLSSTCLNALIDRYNSNIPKYWQDSFFDKWKAFTDNSAILKNAVLDNSGLTVYFKQPTKYPTFVIDLKAKDVGIIKLSGTPQISNCPSSSSCTFRSNELGKTTLTVKNVGTGEGYFNLAFENCNKINAYSLGSNQLGSFQADESKTVEVNIQGSTTGSTETGSCVVSVYDTNAPDKKASCTMSCKISPNVGGQCDEGSSKCRINSVGVDKCVNGNWVASTECTGGKCGYDANSNAICKSVSECKKVDIGCADSSECCDSLSCNQETNKCTLPVKPSECAWYDIPCKISTFWNWLKDIFSGALTFVQYLKIFISFVVGIVSIFAVRDFADIFKSLKKMNWLAWTISVIFGTGIGYLIYSFLSGIWFWVAVVGIIIYKLTFSRIIRMFRRR